MAPVAVLSHIVIDEVFDVEGRKVAVEVGGAGAYAAVGASLARPGDVTLLVAGVGTDDRALLAEWCSKRRISTAGLFDVGEKSPRTRIQYFSDGERKETPVYGVEHFNAHTPLPQHIPPAQSALSGVYLFHDHEAAYWESVSQFAQTSARPILWEISADSCAPEHREAVWGILGGVDILSINTVEASALLGTADQKVMIEQLAAADAIVLLRRGAAGSLVLNRGRIYEVGTAPTRAVDPTGGGNSYSGAFLSAFAEGGDLVHAARTASAVASAVVDAPGAPEVSEDARRGVRAAALGVSVTRV